MTLGIRRRVIQTRRRLQKANARGRLQERSDKGKENVKRVTGKAIKKVLE